MRAAVPFATALCALALAGCGAGGSHSASGQASPPAAVSPHVSTSSEPPASATSRRTPAAKPRPPAFVKGPTFAKRDLKRIALRPGDAPLGLRYVKEESGPQTLESIGLYLPRQINAVKRHGFLSAHDVIFGPAGSGSDRRVGERLWLFRTAKGASGFLEQSRQDALDLAQLSEISAPTLGNESWAAQGLLQVGGGLVVTHAFRYGNVVFTVSMNGGQTTPTSAETLALARTAFARAR